MLAQVLHVPHFEAGPLRRTEALRDGDQLAVGKDETPDETAGLISAPLRALLGDRVVQKESAGTQRLVRSTKIIGEARTADVLEHPDAHDLVEALAAQLAIIAELDRRERRDPAEAMRRRASSHCRRLSVIPSA